MIKSPLRYPGAKSRAIKYIAPIIPEFLEYKDGEQVFLFLDPPYYFATKSALCGENGNLHKIFDHIINFVSTMVILLSFLT